MKTKLILLMMVLMPSFGIAQNVKVDATLKSETVSVVIKNLSNKQILIYNQDPFDLINGSFVVFASYNASGKCLGNIFKCISKDALKYKYFLDAGQEFSYTYDLTNPDYSFNNASEIKINVHVLYYSDKFYNIEKTLIYNKK